MQLDKTFSKGTGEGGSIPPLLAGCVYVEYNAQSAQTTQTHIPCSSLLARCWGMSIGAHISRLAPCHACPCQWGLRAC